MSYQIKWLSDEYVDADIGDIFTVVDGVFFDKGGDGRVIAEFVEGVEYERIGDSASTHDSEPDSNVSTPSVTLIRYNGKLYEKHAFEEAIKGLVTYSVE